MHTPRWPLPVALSCTLVMACSAMACNGGDKADIDTGSEPDPETWELRAWGEAPWDPVEADGSRSGEQAAVILGADGGELPTEAWVLPSGETATWVPAEDLVPGSYTLVAPGDAAVTLDHEVLPYGTAEAFDVSELAGRTWAYDLETGDFSSPRGLGSLLISQVGGLWLHIEEVDADQATLDVVIQGTGEANACLVLRVTATVDEQGQLWWSESSLDANSEPDPIALSELFLHAGATEDGGSWGGVEGGLAVETSAIDAGMNSDLDSGENPWNTCDFASGLAVPCYDCAGLGETCLDLVFHAAVFDEVSEVDWVLGELPSCGADLSGIDTPDFDFECDFSGFSCSVLAFGLMGGVGWRRRRGGSPKES